MKKPNVGITIGDYNGIGPEVTLKALKNNKILTRREVIEGISGCSQLGGEIHFRHFLEKRLLTFCKNK